MSGPVELNLTPPTSAVRNTVGREKEQTSKNSDRPASDATLWEYCDKHYHQLLPIIAEKVHNEKVQQEKMKEVKARLNFEGCSGRNLKIQKTSQYSKSRTPNKKGDLRRRLKLRRSRSVSRSPEPTNVFSKIRRDRSALPRYRRGDKRKREGDMFHRLGGRGRSVSAHLESRYQGSRPRRTEPLLEVKTTKGALGVKVEKTEVKHRRGRSISTIDMRGSRSLHPSNLLLQTPKKELNAKQRQNI
ncbi:hypothetical protein Tco_1478250 [Tanacetum coccineum]